MSRLTDLSSRWANALGGFVRRRPASALFVIIVIALPATALVYRERIAFVSPCVNNGNAFRDCSCTYDALPNLPKSYQPVARAWAHGTSLSYGMATLTFGGSQIEKTAKSELGLDPTAKHDELPVRTPRLKVAETALKRLGLISVKATVAPLATLILLNKLTSDYAEARGVLGKTCGGTFDRILGSYGLLKDNIAMKLSAVTNRKSWERAKSASSTANEPSGWVTLPWSSRK